MRHTGKQRKQAHRQSENARNAADSLQIWRPVSQKAAAAGLSGQEDILVAETMTIAIWDSWIAMGLIATGAWALSSVIDVCFVGDGIYTEPSDGPVIAGLFCALPVFTMAGTGNWNGAGWEVVSVAMLSGVGYLLHIYFYFKALFVLNDASNAEIFNTLSVLFVPVLAFVLLDERMAVLDYLAIALAIGGILVLVSFQISRLSWLVIGYLTVSVVCISLSMVMQAWVLQHASYASAVWLFSLAAFMSVVVALALRPRRRRRIGKLCRRFGAVFIAVQLLELGGVFGSQRATDTGPSVSLVALLECSLPLFVMAFSWLLIVISRYWSQFGSVAIHTALSLQTSAAPSKLGSMLLILVARLLVQ